MKIALDYDETYSLDPVFWRDFVALAFAAGHDVRIVTIRDERLDRTAPMTEVESILPVIYTRGVAKRWYLSRFGDGFLPDVWIDDKPESVLQNSSFSPEDIDQWRIARAEGETR